MTSHKYIHYGIDGTGTSDDVQYQETFVDSFVSRIHDIFLSGGLSTSHYSRGPTWEGLGTESLARNALATLTFAVRKAQNDRHGFGVPQIYLSGFSRGAHATLLLCEGLRKKDIPVRAMFLFDAVDESTAPTPPATAQAHAQATYHAVPIRSSDTRPKWNRSGPRQSSGAVTVREFHTTHGGIGGTRHTQAAVDPDTGFINESFSLTTGTTNVKLIEELSGSLSVWTWMEANVRNSRSTYA